MGGLRKTESPHGSNRTAIKTAIESPQRNQTGLMLTAAGLFLRGSFSTSKLTAWPSRRPLRPERSTALTCTKTSGPPPSGAMNPKPFAMLNHFTVPVAITSLLETHAKAGAAWRVDFAKNEAGAWEERGSGRLDHVVRRA